MQSPDSDLVSVVIPIYNAEAYLQETLDSILAQTYPDIEVVAVDDGSTDRSLNILAQYPRNLVIVKQANSGPAAARNRGVREASGRWIAFLDADDLWREDKIEKQVKICRNYKWSYTDAVFIGGVNNGRRDSEFTSKYQGDILEQLVQSNFVGTSSLLIDRQTFLSSGGFNEQLKAIEDWELWIRIASQHAIGYLDEPLLGYRVHVNSASRNSRRTLPSHLRVINQAFAPGGPAEKLIHLKSNALGNSCSTCSHIAEEELDYGFALQWAFLAGLL